jgi:ATP-binding cassette subfamily B protein
LTTLLSLAGAIYIQKIVDNVIVDGNRNLLRLLSIAMLAILGLKALIGYFQSVLMLRSAQKIDAGLLLGYYRHLMRLPQSFFDTMRVGEITSRMRDAVVVRNFLNGTILGLVLNPLILIVALAAMFAYSWKLAVFSLALVPAYVILYFASDWLNRRYQREIMERSADLDAQLVESLHSMSVVRSCGIEDEMSFRSETRLVRVLKRVWSAANAGFVIGGTGSFVTQAYSIGLLWIGADLVLNSQLTAGELMSCNALAGYITGPIVAIIGMNTSIRSATTATDRLYEILDLEREKDEGAAELHLDREFELVIDSLNFSYPGRLATLENVSLKFQSGTITALVGKSGCGKSTLLGLLQRHYLPGSGKILIGGVELQYLQLRALRSNIAYVPQKIDLLGGTVLENIAPSEAQPDLPRIIELCRSVGILEFIESLPRGFQTLITENGANLSGGQKQRLAIVRALYSDAPVVLMDEPSSALDVDSEAVLVRTLESMRERGKLIILAVHNRRMLSICDRIVELSEGKVVGRTETVEASPAEPAALSNGIPMATSRVRGGGLVDADATEATQRLFERLRDRRYDGVLLGQVDANVMGINASGKGWFLDEERCDVHTVTGKHPAVYGFDIGPLNRGWTRSSGHIVPKVREAFSREGVVTVEWHPENLITGEGCHAGSAVPQLLPGAAGNRLLVEQLDLIADHLGNLCDEEGRSIPVIFRPWHAPNAGRTWWASPRCTPDEYIRLYRFTVMHLRDVRRVHNFLYAFSISLEDGAFRDALEYYPGDACVDVVGLDAFGDTSAGYEKKLLEHLRQLVSIAERKGKIPALTSIGFKRSDQECGLGYCETPRWLTEHVIGPINSDPVARRISYAVFWRNDAYNLANFHLPHPGSAGQGDLIAAASNPYVVMGDRLQRIAAPALEPVEVEARN